MFKLIMHHMTTSAGPCIDQFMSPQINKRKGYFYQNNGILLEYV